MKDKSYDSKSYDLAEHFLQDEELLNNETSKRHLASVIQECVEDEIEWMRRELKQEDK